ncbi:MAG: hypothetical protein PVF43_16415 [Candidatus Eiseniibacteriota bacterium]|jgi:hypothetical protein
MSRRTDEHQATSGRRELPRDPERLLDYRREEAITELGRATRRYRSRMQDLATGHLIERHPLASLAVCITGGFLLARGADAAAATSTSPSGDGSGPSGNGAGGQSPSLAGTLAATAVTVGRRYLLRKLREVLSESGA